SGVAVVTVDKGPVVHGYRRLAQAARDGGVRIAHTGTTGVRPPREIHGKSVTEIAGIFNGTTNFILTRMWQDSVPFAAALAEARASGIAEPDPALDVDGWDTACKILILASRWMGAESTLAAVSRRGIGAGTEALVDSARASGDAVRLIGRARKTAEGVQIAVAPERAGPESRFFNVSGTSKGALFTTAEGEQFFSEGRSGREQIAQTILEDILSVAGSSGSAYPADPPCPP
ncbi:MAG: homoserine dehydrogenase, partial [Acidobacteria bacterium]|nr:homoserine dehydrogenase [Acidobacteriota bacterium]